MLMEACALSQLACHDNDEIDVCNPAPKPIEYAELYSMPYDVWVCIPKDQALSGISTELACSIRGC